MDKYWQGIEEKKVFHQVERKRPHSPDSEEGAEQNGDFLQVQKRKKFRARPRKRKKEEKEDGDDTMPAPPTQQDSRPTQPRSSASSPRTFWYTPEGYMAENSFVRTEGSDRSTEKQSESEEMMAEEQSESEEIEMGVWGTTGAT